MRVTVGEEYEGTADAAMLVSGDERCLYLRFYLGSALHWEHTAWQCDRLPSPTETETA